jgi:hypothetical protein
VDGRAAAIFSVTELAADFPAVAGATSAIAQAKAMIDAPTLATLMRTPVQVRRLEPYCPRGVEY